MSLFALILVDQDSDYIYGLECIKSFATAEEANLYISSFRKVYEDSVTARKEYCEKYAENEDVPSTIEEYNKKYNTTHYSGTLLGTKALFAMNINTGYIKLSDPNFNPPVIDFTNSHIWRDCFIAEIK